MNKTTTNFCSNAMDPIQSTDIFTGLSSSLQCIYDSIGNFVSFFFIVQRLYNNKNSSRSRSHSYTLPRIHKFCSRYDVNSMEFDDAIEQLSGHDLAPAPPPASPPTVSISMTSSSSASFIHSTDFIRGAPLFADDVDTRGQAMGNDDVERKASFRDEAFRSPRDNSLQEVKSLQATVSIKYFLQRHPSILVAMTIGLA